ncbi:MAG: LamG-like jellyroll fold domain-containing protein, partial [Verrucomicrobiales bacterium]
NTQVDRTGPWPGSNQNNFLYANPQWIHEDLMANAEYRLRFADRVQKHFFRGGALTEAACIDRFKIRTDQVRPALKAYAARWADARYTPSYNTGLWEAEIAWIMNTWMPGRSAVVLDQLRADDLYPATGGAPLFTDDVGSEQPDGTVPPGFQLHLADPSGDPGTVIYYTLDGTDPRLAGTPAPAITATLVDYADERAYHVPASATDGFAAAALAAVPLAYYPFDSDAADHATADGAQDGAFMNGAAISGDGHTGGGALLLDGVDDHVFLGDPAALQITGEISIAAWVKANAAPSQTFGNIIAKGYWLSPNSEIFLRYAGQIDSWRIASWDGAVHGTEVAGASNDIGVWTHLVGTYDGTHWNLYRNGELAASKADATGAIAVPNDWVIGARGTGTERFFNGYIDELYLFDTALDAGDVGKLYAESEPAWQQPDYAPAATWTTGAGGLGYDQPGGALLPLIGTDVQAAMQGASASLLTRAAFEIDAGDLAALTYLELNIAYDGGFVAYLNGEEVHRENAPAALDGASAATAAHSPADVATTIDLSDHLSLLNPGANLLAVHSLNDDAGSPDHLISYQLRGGAIPAAVAPSAVAYSGPITIGGPVSLNVRAFRDGEWSPLSSATFHTGAAPASAENLAVSQIHYHPATAADDPHSAKDYEYLEIMNIGAQTIDLNGLHLRGEVSFDFSAGTFLAPGERAQVVSDPGAFAARYPAQPTRVLGEFSGNLANEGGRLWLFTGASDTVRDFDYDDAPPWPEEADGGGFALVLIRPETNPDHADPANWRRSTMIDGSPGESDAALFSGDPGADDDGDSLTALLEHALGTSDAEPTAAPWLASGGEGFAVQITRRPNADDVRWEPETSSDLIVWSIDPSRYSRSVLPAAGESGMVTEVYRLAEPDPGEPPPRFIRFRATLRP